MLTESEDALIGTKLLEHHQVAIEFPGGRVIHTARRRTGRKR
jgi:hypothetical protein